MKNTSLQITILGSTITSSWGNKHAPVYAGLVRELVLRGHRVLFMERDKPLYAENRDMTTPPYGRFELYYSVTDLKARFRAELGTSDAIILGSGVPNGIDVANAVLAVNPGTTAFYDLDAPTTLDAVEMETCTYLNRNLMPQFDLYLSAAGGRVLARLEQDFQVHHARPLYCGADTAIHYPDEPVAAYDLGFVGPSTGEQFPLLERFLINPALLWTEGRFAIAGHPLPTGIQWPQNVKRIQHLPSPQRRSFYNRQRFTLNIPSASLALDGYAPTAALFEAAACGTPVITENWPGLDTFFEPGREIITVRSTAELVAVLRDTPISEAEAIGQRARERILAEHTAAHRAAELECMLAESLMEKTAQSSTRQGASLML